MKSQRAAGGGIAVWNDLPNGLLRAANTCREPNPLSIRSVCSVHAKVDVNVKLSGTAIIVILPSQAIAWGGFILYQTVPDLDFSERHGLNKEKRRIRL